MDELPLALAGGFENSTVTLYHNRFRDIVPPRSGSGPYTVGTYCGVATFGTATFPTVNVGHPTSNNGPLLSRHANAFIGCQQGVFAERPQHINVRGNTLDRAVRDGVFMRRIHGSDPHVERNTFTDCNSGILVGDSPNVTGTVSSNTITGSSLAFRFGIQLQVLSYSSAPQPGVFPMQVRDNTIDLRGNGMWINASWNVNVEGNTILVIRGTNTLEAVNGIFATSNTLLRIANNPSISSAGAGSTDTLVAGIYVNRSFQTMVLCNTMRNIGRCAVFEGDCEPSDFLGNTMRNGVDGFVVIDGKIGPQGGQSPGPGVPSRPVENIWQGTTWRSWTNMLGSSLGINSLFFVRPNQDVPILMRAPASNPNQRMNPISVGSGQAAHVDCYSTLLGNGTASGVKNVAVNRLPGNGPGVQAAQFRADEWAFTTLLKEPSLIQSDPIIQNYHAGCVGSSLGATCNSNEMLIVPDSLSSSQSAMQIVQQSQSEINHKTVLNLRLAGAGLNGTEIQQLQSISAQCEAQGGKAVNLARGLLACEGILVWEDPGCPNGAKMADGPSDKDSHNSTIKGECWPNPTSGSLYIKFNLSNVVGTVSLYDSHGKLLTCNAFDYNGHPLELDASSWSQGLLVVKVDLANGRQFQWRVVVQR